MGRKVVIEVAGGYTHVGRIDVVNVYRGVGGGVDAGEGSEGKGVCEGVAGCEAARELVCREGFVEVMGRAEERGFCVREGEGWRWGKKVEAAYFASVASHYFELTRRRDYKGDVSIAWRPFEVLFGLKGMRLTYNDWLQCKTALRRKGEIDDLFRK